MPGTTRQLSSGMSYTTWQIQLEQKFFSKDQTTYRKSSKETRGYYSFSEGPNAGFIRVWTQFGHFCLLFFKFSAGLIRMRVLFEGGSLSRIYGIQKNVAVFFHIP